MPQQPSSQPISMLATPNLYTAQNAWNSGASLYFNFSNQGKSSASKARHINNTFNWSSKIKVEDSHKNICSKATLLNTLRISVRYICTSILA